MKKALLYGPGDIRVEDVPLPEPGSDAVRVRVAVSTIYGTDVKIFRGFHTMPYPTGLGGEFAGVVDAVGAGVTDLKLGMRVTFGGLPHCGNCRMCAAGRTNLCLGVADPMAGHGHAFAQFAVYSRNQLVVIPDGVGDDDAATVSSLDLSLNLLELAAPPPQGKVLVMGAGAVGVAVVQTARALGLEVAAVDLYSNHLEVARRVGASHMFQPSELAAALPGIWPDGPDVVVDMVGSDGTIDTACALVAPAGAVVVVAPGDWRIPSRPVAHKELRIVGVRSGHHQARALALIGEGRLGLKSTITHRFPLEKIGEAFLMAERPESVRVALDVNSRV